jgi:hypothetical protein
VVNGSGSPEIAVAAAVALGETHACGESGMTSPTENASSLAHLTVSTFDVHLWSKPFDPDDFNPNVHFLWSAPKYRAARAAGQKVEIGDLVLFPLKDEVGHNHFWSRYENAVDKLPAGSDTSLGDSREFLWPLRCRPRNLQLSFDPQEDGAPPAVRVTTWLWPFGWSSVTEFRMKAPFTLRGLEHLGATLQNRTPGPFIFGGGEALSQSGVFKELAGIVRQSVGVSGKAADTTRLGRHVFLMLELPKDMEARPVGSWSAADKVRMVGALQGHKAHLPDILSNGFLFTPLGRRSFAVTEFDSGTLLVLHHWKNLGTSASRETTRCLFHNLRMFSVVYLTLHRFIGYAKGQTDLDSAVTNARQMLASLPEEYRNAFSQAFKTHYASLN